MYSETDASLKGSTMSIRTDEELPCMVTGAQVGRILGIHPSTVAKYALSRGFPAPTVFPSGRKRYHRDEILAWRDAARMQREAPPHSITLEGEIFVTVEVAAERLDVSDVVLRSIIRLGLLGNPIEHGGVTYLSDNAVEGVRARENA